MKIWQPLQAHVDDIALHAQRWGWRHTLHWLLMRMLVRCLRVTVYVVHVRPRSGVILPPQVDCQIVQLDAPQLTSLCADPQLDLTSAFVADALARGDICVGAMRDGELLSYVWEAFTTTPLFEDLSISFSAPYRFGYKAFTAEASRGLHLQDAIAWMTDCLSDRHGRHCAISVLETHNYPSRRANLRRGNTPAGFIVCARWSAASWLWNSRQMRRSDIRVSYARAQVAHT